MSSACLYMVATPIGNLADISSRALDILAQVDVVFAEDTRHSRKLFNHYGISTALKSLYSQNEKGRCKQVVAILEEGKSVAYISDAGTPAVSDPGSLLVNSVIEAGHLVRPVAGPSALAAGLSVCGFMESSANTLFLGFLPIKGSKRRDVMEQIAKHKGLVVLYEGPHRLLKTLDDLLQIHGVDRALCVCRELSKIHEEIIRTTLVEAAETLAQKVKGEFTLVLGPHEEPKKMRENKEIEAKLQQLLKAGLSRRDAAKALAILEDIPKKELYRLQQNVSP